MADGCSLGTYLENYLDSVSGLPAELKRNFSLIEELDERTKDTVEEIDSISRKSIVDDERRNKAKEKIRKRYRTCIEFADEKISIATQTYEMVDKHIRRLDIDLKKFETELEKTRQLKELEPQTEVPITKSHRGAEGLRAIKRSKKGKGRKAVKKNRALNPFAKPLNVDLDMPVDPNEPTYCFCNRVSFGEMVGCDNPDCRVEWFHFECVGLKETPKGKWLCPECRVVKGEEAGVL